MTDNEKVGKRSSMNPASYQRSIDQKPPYSVSKLVGQALVDCSGGRSSLRASEICSWILETYPYYESREKDVVKGVSVALSQTKYYVKGKKCRSWRIAPKFLDMLTIYFPLCTYRPQKINKNSGKVHPYRIEREIKKLEAENNSVFLHQKDGVLMNVLHVSEKSSTLHVSEKSPKSEISTRRSWGDAIVNPDSTTDTITSIAKEERPVLDVQEKRSGNILRSSETFELSHKSKLKKIDLTLDDTDDDSDLEILESNDIDVIDLTENVNNNSKINIFNVNNPNLECPICSKKFINHQKLGEHLINHKLSNPSVDVRRKKETFQNLASTIFGSDKNVPICVFTGNVYLSPT